MEKVEVSPEEARGIDESAERLRIAVARIQRALRLSRPNQDLTPSQLEVVIVLARRGPRRMADLAEDVGINPTMLSRVAAKLEESGLAERRNDPLDARATHLCATRAAEELVESIRTERRDLLRAALERLSVEERERLDGALCALDSLVELLRGGVE
ncbi:MAG: MarR family transcriptional regulator [Acidimicrobiaceae bacterium]|nr:MarR family transcriptional regulator [Acidimicrobiaceae bacterium]